MEIISRGRHLVSQYGFRRISGIVSETRRGPDFFILGAMKSGTTSLFSYIVQHPDIAEPVKKELHYYDHKIYGDWSLDEYLANFPRRREHELSGEATAYYLRHPHAPGRISRDFPEARLIALLRDPVERAYSHYQQKLSKGREDRSFFEAVRGEEELISADWEKKCEDESHQGRLSQHSSYLARGRYAEQIELWHQHFPKEKLLVMFTAELGDHPQREVQRVFEFLGLPRSCSIDTRVKKKCRDYKPMSNEAREWCESYFAEHNERLESLLGRKLPWSKS